MIDCCCLGTTQPAIGGGATANCPLGTCDASATFAPRCSNTVLQNCCCPQGQGIGAGQSSGSFTISAAHLIADWEQCGSAAQCNTAGAVGGGCCHNTFGSSANDHALATVLDSIRWSGASRTADGTSYDQNKPMDGENSILVNIGDLAVGTQYKLQLLFQERCCTRGFSIFIDDTLGTVASPGQEIVHDFVPMREQGGVSSQGTGAGSGAFVAYEFIAKAASLKVRPRTRGALNTARGAVY